MSRLVLCLRVADRPVPHVRSVSVLCHTCQQAVWLDPNIGSETGDQYICNGCMPGYEDIKQTVRADPGQHDHASITDLFRAQAEAYGLAGTMTQGVARDSKPKGPPS